MRRSTRSHAAVSASTEGDLSLELTGAQSPSEFGSGISCCERLCEDGCLVQVDIYSSLRNVHKSLYHASSKVLTAVLLSMLTGRDAV